MKRPYESTDNFKLRLRVLLRTTQIEEKPCVRTPKDRGYYPPQRKIRVR